MVQRTSNTQTRAGAKAQNKEKADGTTKVVP
jgi:hypothetical protein